MTTVYCVRELKTGKLQAIDRDSGGYPYGVDSFLEARHWPTLGDAQQYALTMNGGSYGCFLAVQLEIVAHESVPLSSVSQTVERIVDCKMREAARDRA